MGKDRFNFFSDIFFIIAYLLPITELIRRQTVAAVAAELVGAAQLINAPKAVLRNFGKKDVNFILNIFFNFNFTFFPSQRRPSSRQISGEKEEEEEALLVSAFCPPPKRAPPVHW